MCRQSSLEKRSVLSSSRVTNALDVGCSTGKSPAAGAKKTMKPRKVSGLNGTNNPTEGLAKGNDNSDVDAV